MSQSNARVFNNRFIVKRKISSGSFGVVFCVIDRNTNQECALKLEREDNEETRSLDREITILELIQHVVGVPKLLWHGHEQEHHIMVIQLLGRDLGYYFRNLRRFSLKCSVQIAYEAVQILSHIHQAGVVHRDIKPENMLMSSNSDQLYIVDFGISKIFMDGDQHIPYKEDKPFLGTTRYASVAAHLGRELSRKDDLESLIYVILYFIRGSLPWQNLPVSENERTKAVGELKQKLDLNELCSGQAVEFAPILTYLRQLGFREEPDYNYILGCLSAIAENNNFVLDGRYDWSEVSRVPRQCSLDSRHSNVRETSPRQLLKSNSSKLSNQMIWQIPESVQNGQLHPQQPARQNSSNVLALPDPNIKPGEQAVFGMRSEQRHFSNSSSQSKMGSISSIKLKYTPSTFQIVNVPRQLSGTLNVNSKDGVYTDDMDEFFGDQALCVKMHSRQVSGFQNQFKAKNTV